MLIKNKDAARIARQNERLRKMYEIERDKTAGYEELAKVQNAYVAILLKKLNATETKPVTITNDDVKEVLGKDIVKVNIVESGSWQFYIKEG